MTVAEDGRGRWPPGDGEMARRIRELDWTKTPLGPIERWPRSLRTIVAATLPIGLPMVVMWGPDLVQIYNDPCCRLMGVKHPTGLGQPARACWPEVWAISRPIYERALAGETVVLDEAPYRTGRRTPDEDAWFNLSFSPLRDDEGAIAGVLLSGVETTERRRREDALRASEATCRALFEAMDEGCALCEASLTDGGDVTDVRFLEVNPAFDRMSGLSNAAGRTVRELLPFVEPEWFEAAGRALSTGEPVRREGHAASLGRWLDCHFSRVGGLGSRTLAVLFQDVTAGREAEEALRRSEEALRKSEARQAYLLKLSDALRSLADPIEIQAQAARVLGERLGASRVHYGEIEDDPASGERCVVIAGSYASGARPITGRVRLSDFSPTRFEAMLAGQNVVADVAKDPLLSAEERERYLTAGIRAWLSVPLLKDGAFVAVLAVNQATPRAWTAEEESLVRDTADRTWDAVAHARAERRLHDQHERLLDAATAARVQAEEASRTKDEFLATLSHELRTPLAPILLWSRALRSGTVAPGDFGRAVDAIVACAESQSRLIEDLLDLSRLQAGKVALVRRSAPVEAIARKAVEVVRPAAEAKGVTLTLDVDPDVGAAFFDPDRIQQVFWNLLSNAVKFTPGGGRASLRVRRAGDQIEAVVADTGQGIAPGFLPHLFKRFRQVDMGESREHSGLGIGLALCRHLIELHDGTIQGRSEGPGRGAVFTVRIPFIEGEQRATAPPPSGVEDVAPPSLHGLRVLLVEDHRSTRDALSWTLERAGSDVRAVADGPEALDLLGAGEGAEPRWVPDVIVCDIGLPGMSGHELIARIAEHRAAAGEPPIPACAVSAHTREVDRRRAIEAGFELYIAKPVSAEALLGAVEELASLAQR